MIHKIINSLFVLLFAFLLAVAVLSTISIIEAHATWKLKYVSSYRQNQRVVRILSPEGTASRELVRADLAGVAARRWAARQQWRERQRKAA